MIVPQVALNVWRAACDQAIADLFRVRTLLTDRRPQDADQLISRMIEQSILLGLSMQRAGADAPRRKPLPLVLVLPVGLIRSEASTEAAQRLALLLRAVYVTAKEVDREREERGETPGMAGALEPLLEAAELAAFPQQQGERAAPGDVGEDAPVE